MPRLVLAANWKVNYPGSEVIEAFNKSLDTFPVDKCEFVVAPTFLQLREVRAALDKRIKVAAQNCYISNGAYTGEVSIPMLEEAGVDYVILGHSERRAIFGESSELVAKKVKAVIETSKMDVILCIGETIAERQAGKTNEVNEAQLAPVFECLTPEQWKRVVIAYEPVWAIGTGLVATPEDAETANAHIRDVLQAKIGNIAKEIPIQYGGSVKPENAAGLSTKNTDGFLVGGAGLVASFPEIGCKLAEVKAQ